MQLRASRLAPSIGAFLVTMAALSAVASADGSGDSGAAGGTGVGGTGVAAVVVDGRGYGHGVGLSQDGALWMGRAGVDLSHILGQFFPGTSLARSGGQVRVQVLSEPSGSAEVVFPDGGQVQDALTGQQSPGFPVRVRAGAAVVVRWSGDHYSVEQPAQVSAQSASSAFTLPGPSGSTTTTTTTTGSGSTTTEPESTTTTTPGVPSVPSAPTTTTTAPTTSTTSGPGSGSSGSGSSGSGSSGAGSSGSGRSDSGAPRSTRPLWLVPDDSATTTVSATGRGYRGVVEAAADGSAVDLVDQLDVETYLRGMGEVQDPSWPAASLEAQAIVERTYALRGMAAAGELCDDTRCQVYLGVGGEYGAQDEAVARTGGEVLAYGSRLAATVFSANGGGYSASPEEGFGTSDTNYPYLRAAPYFTRDPEPWSLTIGLSDVAARLGYSGTLTSAAVSTVGPSGRAISVALAGSAGPSTVSGIAFEAALGLKSNFFQLHDTVVGSPPAPPPPVQISQALPSDASALAATVASPVAARANSSRRVAATLRRPGPVDTGTAWWGWIGLVLVAGVGLGAAGVAVVAFTRRPPD